MKKLHFLKNTQKFLTLTLSLILITCFFNACTTEETTTTDTCSISISSASASPSSFGAGATVAGYATVSDKVGLSSTELSGLVKWYLSNDATYSSGDEQLTAFLQGSPTTQGSSISYKFNIEIDFTVASGAKYLIAHIDSRPCGNGQSTSAANKAIAVTIQ